MRLFFKIVIAIFIVFACLFVLAFNNMVIPNVFEGEQGMPYSLQSLDKSIKIPFENMQGVARVSNGKLVYEIEWGSISQNIGTYEDVPINVYYDVFMTDLNTDVFLLTTTGTVKIIPNTDSPTLKALTFTDIVQPYDTLLLLDNISKCYDAINYQVNNEFNQGFPSDPTEESTLGYLKWFFESIGQSFKSAFIALDYIIVPVKIYGGTLF